MMRQASNPDVGDAPLITVVTAVRNRVRELPACLASVAGQTYRSREHIVIDGGSTDGTRDLLEERSEDLAWWTSEPDSGVYDAWNKALAKARGGWICFLGADDFFWRPDVLERIAPHLVRTDEAVKLVYGRLALVDSSGQVRGFRGRRWEAERRRFLGGIMRIPHPGLFHRRTLFEASGGFDASYRLAGDYELLLRELKRGRAVHVPDIVVAGMRLEGATHRLAGRFRSLAEVRRARRRHGLAGFSPRIAWAYAKTLFLTCAQAALGARWTGRLRRLLRPAVRLETDEHHTVW